MTGTESEAEAQSSLLNVADVPKGDLRPAMAPRLMGVLNPIKPM